MTLITKDNVQLFDKSWLVEEPIANLVLIHGMGEHIMRYEYWASLWNQAKINVFGVDFRGHGQSHGKRGHINNYDELIGDAAIIFQKAKNYNPDIPIILYGHSMGGNVVLNILKHNSFSPDLAIVTSPWIKLAFQPSKKELLLAKIGNKLLPSFSQSTKVDTNGISQDPEVVALYQQDPLIHDQITARMFHEVYTKGLTLLEGFKAPCPLMLIHGDKDRFTSCDASKEFVKRDAAINIKIYPSGFHELHQEPFKKDVFIDLFEWVYKNLPKK